MEPMTVRELLDATGGILLKKADSLEQTIYTVETDSRAVHPGALFVALRGEQTDGHRYITAALEGGAAGCLTEEEPETFLPDKFYIKVPSTMEAIGRVAKAYAKKFKIPVIGITGSVGKTTTKDMIACVLGRKFNVLKTEGNFNNELGLPLTLFRLRPEHELCVLEMGMNHFGEIDYLTRIICPDVAVITNIGDAHIENLGSRENILKAKQEIFHYMTADSLAILNGDDLLLRTLEGAVAPQTVFCGENEALPYAASDVCQMGSDGLQCMVKTPAQTFSVLIPALGHHMIYPALMACAIGEHFGMTAKEMAEGIAAFIPTKMRMNVVKCGELTILDDAYNANPQSMRAALEVLGQSGGTKRIAILGDMFELGILGPELHRSVGEYAGSVAKIDTVLAVGKLSQHIFEGARQTGVPEALYAETKEEAKTLLQALVKPGAVILVKASRGMAFEELVNELQRLSAENGVLVP